MSARLIRTARRGVGAVASAYQYAILRLVPNMERGETINLGVAVLCRPQRFLGVKMLVDRPRISAFAPGVDLDLVCAQLAGIESVADGDAAAGPMAGLDISERFNWIASPSNTVIQPSPVHPGLTEDAPATLERLYRQLVVPVES